MSLVSEIIVLVAMVVLLALTLPSRSARPQIEASNL